MNKLIILTEEQQELLLMKREIRRLSNIIRFHKLDEIDIKHRKFSPGEDEYPYFEAKEKNENETSLFGCFANLPIKITIPSDRVELRAAVDRMKSLEQQHHNSKKVIDV